MSDPLLRELRSLERALSTRRLSTEQRRRLQPIIALLCRRLARSVGRSAA